MPRRKRAARAQIENLAAANRKRLRREQPDNIAPDVDSSTHDSEITSDTSHIPKGMIESDESDTDPDDDDTEIVEEIKLKDFYDVLLEAQVQLASQTVQSRRPKHYTGTSRTTRYRQKKAREAYRSQGYPAISQWFSPVSRSHAEAPQRGDETVSHTVSWPPAVHAIAEESEESEDDLPIVLPPQCRIVDLGHQAGAKVHQSLQHAACSTRSILALREEDEEDAEDTEDVEDAEDVEDEDSNQEDNVWRELQLRTTLVWSSKGRL
ncbi:hypothetical protein BC834DRAFT_1000983 [Gloeopeniophorella convolvens]|nr:hypothetical protein BC834DRAFT_1000983 [Gloeopeniophorella convolvens]